MSSRISSCNYSRRDGLWRRAVFPRRLHFTPPSTMNSESVSLPRETRAASWFESLSRDLRQSVRALLKQPGFTATALGTLALCIGANLAIFAVVDAIVFRPLPFPESERLVSVYNSYPKAGVERSSTSVANYYDRRGAIKAFESVSAYYEDSVITGAAGAPRRVPIARVTPEFFSTLRVPLAMGKTFTDAEMAYGPDLVAVLTDAFWH